MTMGSMEINPLLVGKKRKKPTLKEKIRGFFRKLKQTYKLSHIKVTHKGDVTSYDVESGMPKSKVKNSFYMWIDRAGRIYNEVDEDD